MRFLTSQLLLILGSREDARQVGPPEPSCQGWTWFYFQSKSLLTHPAFAFQANIDLYVKSHAHSYLLSI